MVDEKPLILWDFDGTLVDTMLEHIKLAREVISKHFGIKKEKAEKLYLETTGLPFEKQLEIIFPGKKFKKQRNFCAKEYTERKIKEVYGKIKPIKGALEILRKLSKLKYRQFILTGTEKALVQKWLQKNKISGVNVLGKEKGQKKDHIKILRRKYPRKRLFLVSDSLKDLTLPVEIKIGFFKTEKEKKWLIKAKPNFLINNLKLVEKILKK